MHTFFEICPPELYSEKFGGRRSDMDGYCKLINGSELYSVGLDNIRQESLKSFNVNSIGIDQAEEIDESSYLMVDARVGRWSGAEIPESLKNFNFPINEFTGKQEAPAYSLLAVNPDSRIHWVYKMFHADSPDRLENHVMINCSSTSNPALNKETLKIMMSRGPEWVNRFVYGEWGISDASIHNILPDSVIEPTSDWLSNFLKKAKLFRVLDHGEGSPTCCLWFAVVDKLSICYREYYEPNKLISEHRRNIADLSQDEHYNGNYADPSIFHLTSQKNGGRWSVADEYLSKLEHNAPGIGWIAADNNEFANRNRINEMLQLHEEILHPVTNVPIAPLLYFVKKSPVFPQGCFHVMRETNAARREILGTDNGTTIYGDDRVKSISDHAYDPLRYFASIKAIHKHYTQVKIPEGSFFAAVRELKKRAFMRKYNYGQPVALSA